MRRLLDWLSYWTDPLGPFGRVGLGLVVAASVLLLAGLLPSWLAVHDLRSQNNTLREQQRRGLESAPDPRSKTVGSGPERALSELFESAQSNNLILDQASYQSAARAASTQLSLPTSGSYSEIRGFLRALLVSPSGFDIQELRLSRASIEEPVLEASFRIVLGAVSPSTAQGGTALETEQSAGSDLFLAQGWNTSDVNDANAPKGPPDFPFEYVGQWQEGPARSFFFATFDNRVLQVRLQDVLLEAWRFERAEDNELTFTYLPLRAATKMRISQ
jgi:hypothetical protein